ncbi:MAG: TonB-dependent receptor [Acidobacteria bacterium]|nr:TonB-dependent receptor [Acidobacteriota bacterium]
MLTLLTLMAPLQAQTTSGTLTGTVRTPTGDVVPQAFIQARSTATGVVRAGVSDEKGRYVLQGLPPGEWLVVARLADGPVGTSQTVTLGLQEERHLDLEVGAGFFTEEVTVRAEAPLLNRDSPGEELRIGRQEVEHLPVLNRSVTDLALLDASVLSPQPGTFYGERDAVFLVNGQSGRANSFLVDGMDNNDLTSGTTFNAYLSQQVIREFVVMTSQFSPEFGRASGGVLNVVTQRGTNKPSFSAFFQGAGSNLNQPGSFISGLPAPAETADVSTRLQTGFTYGGPFKKDKAFFFAAYEHQSIDGITPYTGTDRDSIPGGWSISENRDDNLFLRTDFNLNSHNFLMIRLVADDRETPDLTVGGIRTPEAGFSVDEQDIQLASSLTSVLGTNFILESRLLLGTSSFNQFANSERPGVTRTGGIFGGNQLNRQERDEDRIQLVENLTWEKARHTLKFGLDVTRSKTSIDTRFHPQGNFLYETDLPFEPGDCGDLIINDLRQALNDKLQEDPTATFDDIKFEPIDCPGVVGVDDDGDGLIDEPGFIGTYPFVYLLIDGNPSAQINDTTWGLFIQDRWQATPRLRFDYGLRYDLSTFALPASSGVDSTIPNGGADNDTNNIAPRFGFTYRPDKAGRWVVRGGAGIFYDKIVFSFPAVSSITSGTQIGFIFPQGLTLEFTDEILEDALDQGITMDEIRDALLFDPTLALTFSTGTTLDTPYAVQYNLGVEHAVGRRNALRLSATRARGHHQVLLKDLNPVIGSNLGIPEHRDDTVGSIAAFVTEGESWYNGLDLGWTWRGAQRSFSTTYTLSRAENLASDPLKGGITLPPDSDNITGERARTDADRRHRMVLYGESDLPWLGLKVSGMVSLASGAVFNVTTGVDDNQDGTLTDRPEGVGRNSGEKTDLALINDLRRQYNDQRQLNLAPIRTLSEPTFAQVDMRVWKSFPLAGGRGNGQIFIQIFNVLDRFNGGPIEGRVIAPDFGQPIGQVGPARTFELGVRMAF